MAGFVHRLALVLAIAAFVLTGAAIGAHTAVHSPIAGTTPDDVWCC